MCGLHRTRVETRSVGSPIWPQTGSDGLLVVWPQSHCDGFLGFASKPRSMVSSGLALKAAATVSRFDFKTGRYDFLWFGLKITGSVS
jgi:hypothetical protein